MGVRTFLAIDLPEEIHASIAEKQKSLKCELPNINWVKSGNLHVTLKFLGETPESKVEELKLVVGQAVKGLSSFMITVKGFGTFPNSRAPRTMWTGIESDHAALEDLALQIEASVISLGFPEEAKPFRPHLTLARIKKDQREVGRTIEHSGVLADPCVFGQWLVGHVTLFRSDLRPTGSVYTPLWAVPLGES